MTFQSKIPAEQRMELVRLFKTVDYGDKCRFYYDQAAKHGVSFTTIFHAVHGRMSLPRYAAQRDHTEPPIIRALEQVGAQVEQMKEPCDLLVRFRSRVFALEVQGGKRTGTGKRKEKQLTFLRDWEIPIVQTPDEALRAIGAIT